MVGLHYVWRSSNGKGKRKMRGWVERGTVMIRLTRPHFAFYRGYLDGLDIRALAKRYLETSSDVGNAAYDLRVARSSLKWIRDQLMVAARRSPNPSSARLLALAPEKLRVEYVSTVPTLEQYREERDPYDVYSEEDLIALFIDEYGGTTPALNRRVERNNRLRSKQLTALSQLEELVEADPKLTDGVDGWLDPSLAKRLKSAGVNTLGELIEGINRYGYRWYNKIPKIGERAAVQIGKWLSEPSIAQALGATLNESALVKTSEQALLPAPPLPPSTSIVPLERFLIPSEIDGSQGVNRGERCLLSARNDLEAIYAWLATFKPESHTQRAYRKETERFLLWAILERGKPLSSLTVEDCTAYRDFLWYLGRMTPEAWGTRFRIPQAQWLGKRGVQRGTQFWRPFEGQLSESSQKTALVIVQALCQWLTDQHYLNGNPLKAVADLAKRRKKINASRALSHHEWSTVRAYLGEMKKDDRYYRIRFLLALAYSTGLRLSEIASLRRKHLERFTRAGDPSPRWQLVVNGKGDVERTIPLQKQIVDEMRDYFVRRGHDKGFADAKDEIPVIAALPLEGKTGSADDPLTAGRIYKILKAFFQEVGDSQYASEYELGERLQSASTHWLRHTFATHALQQGVSLEVVRGLLGHQSLDTTSLYINSERDRNSLELEKFVASL